MDNGHEACYYEEGGGRSLNLLSVVFLFHHSPPLEHSQCSKSLSYISVFIHRPLVQIIVQNVVSHN